MDNYTLLRGVNHVCRVDFLIRKDLYLILVKILKEIHYADIWNAPFTGQHNFYRGGNLSVYNQETYEAIEMFKNVLPKNKLLDFGMLLSFHNGNRKKSGYMVIFQLAICL